MDQHELLKYFASLDTTAREITAALTEANIRHGYIGGYATSLVGGTRVTSVRSASSWCKDPIS